jgi:lipopolysaccharide transport system ATP-binding protein
MSSEVAIRVRDVSKHYLMFERPEDRLKQMIVPRIARLVGRRPHQYYRDFAALNCVSFEVKRGETVGIIGRNGCGKSTLLQIICGTLRPSGGTVEVNGRIAALLELGAGFNPEFTGRENVYMNATILGLPQAEIDHRFDDIARFADIGLFLDQPVKTYSSGMYVRLAFATAINVDPDILVVDEALAVGDEAFQRKCFARIEDIKDKGGTILFVSHGAQTIVQLCDRAMLLDRGEKILEGRPKTVVSQYQRFINLSGPDSEPVREEIKAMDGWAGSMETVPRTVEAGSGQGDAAGVAKSAHTVGAGVVSPAPDISGPASDESWYDPSLITHSRVEYESTGAHIRDVRITTLDGRVVNVLMPGRPYLYCYTVEYHQPAHQVSFGMMIRTVTGLELGGATTNNCREQLIDEVTPREIYDVAYRFHCHLLPGTYFTNAGTSGNFNGERQFAHRILDAVAFRVQSFNIGLANGIVNFEQEITVRQRRELRQVAQ